MQRCNILLFISVLFCKGLNDLLVVSTPLPLSARKEDVRACSFNEENITQMISVFQSSEDHSIKVGALRQISSMLLNAHSSLLPHFITVRGHDIICDEIKGMCCDDVTVLTEECKPALSACIQILKVCNMHFYI